MNLDFLINQKAKNLNGEKGIIKQIAKISPEIYHITVEFDSGRNAVYSFCHDGIYFTKYLELNDDNIQKQVDAIVELSMEKKYTSLPRSEWRDDLIGRWENLTNGLLGIQCNDDYDYDYDYDDSDNENYNESISYDQVSQLICETRIYFKNLPIKGSMSTRDIVLYESANALRYLAYIFEPEDNKENYAKACRDITALFVELESISR